MEQRFRYKAYNHRGEVIAGVMQAPSPESLAAQLQADGYYIAALEPEHKTARIRWRRKVSPAGLSAFCRQFATLIDSGMSLVSGLGLLMDNAPHEALRWALGDVRQQVAAGASLTRSMARHPQVFPQMMLDMVEAGELSGTLPQILDKLADYYDRESRLRQETKHALMYPGIIVGVALVLAVVVVFVILPMFAGIYSEFGVELPLLTRWVLAGSEFLSRWWHLGAVCLVLGWLAIGRWVQTPKGKQAYDGLLLRLPVVGETIRKILFARFSRTLSLLVGSGLSMIRSLGILERVVGNRVIADGVKQARLGVERGLGLGPSLENAGVFPAFLIQMVAVGEETGALENTLPLVADFYEREAEYTMKNLISVLEPVIIVSLAGFVLIIALSVVLPMFQMSSVML